jgi:DNA-binding transcriptional regulator YbjK
MTSTAAKSKGDTRQRILVACLTVISLEGVDAVTHRRVGQETDLSGGVVSYHFRTREDLVSQSFLFHLEQLDQIGEAIFTEHQTQTLTGFIKAMVEFVKRDQASPYMILADYEMILYAARRKSLALIIKDWEDGIAEQFAKRLRALGFSSASRYARLVINQVRAFELECMINPSLDLNELTRRLRLLLKANT